MNIVEKIYLNDDFQPVDRQDATLVKVVMDDGEVVFGFPEREEGQKGGPGSGHHGHEGRPGQVGGSVTGNLSGGNSLPSRVYRGGASQGRSVMAPEGVYVSTDYDSAAQWGNVTEYRMSRSPKLIDLGNWNSPGAKRMVADWLGVKPADISLLDFESAAADMFIQNEGVDWLKRSGKWDGYRLGFDAFLLGDLSDYFSEEGKKGGPGSGHHDHAGRPDSPISHLLNGIKSLTCALKQTAGANRYGRDLRGAVQSLWNGTISGSDFLRVLKYQLIPLAFEQAWKDGAEAAGIEFDELTDAEKKRLRARIVEERSFVRGFRDYIIDHNKAAGYKLSSLWPRTDLWVNRYVDVVSEARMMAGGDKKLKFQYFPEAMHCSSCLKLNGQVRRASFWRDHDCRPQHPDLECMHSANGPTVCKCEFVETDEPCSRGPLPNWRA